VRRLLAAQAVIGFGDGLWFTIWAIFFTRIQGIPAEQMGLAVGLGGAAGLLAATPAGVLADRRGPREVLAVVIALRGLVMTAYLLVDGFWSLLLVTGLFAAAQSSGAGLRVTLVYGLMPPEQQLRVLAQSRVVQHIAYAVGAGAAGLVLAAGSRAAFVVAVLVNAASFAVTAAITMLVPKVAPVPKERRQAGTKALRDLPYLVIMASTALLSLCWAMLSSGLPLWIANDTAAPLWTAAVAVVISSAAIALFQVRVTRQASGIDGAVRATRISAVALAACCAVFASASWPTAPAAAITVVVLGVGLHVVGELYYVSSRWGLSLGLMGRDAEGQYQGVAASTEAAAIALGPALVTTLVTGLASTGWMLLGALLLLAVAPTGPLSRRAAADSHRITPSPASTAPSNLKSEL
jgi:MFS family permease